jgi:regulator of sigma E protease
MTIIYAIIIFCLLIFLHELGHFVSAKLCGVKVNEFAIGMGPAIFKKQKGETLYAIRIFPIGGYCAMEGEDEDSDDERAFNNQPAWQRAIILFAGSFMNLVTAVVLLIIISFWTGTPTTTIHHVATDKPAYEAGLQDGDTIVAVNGEKTDTWTDVTNAISEYDGDSVNITIVRDGEEMTITSGLYYDETTERNKIGINPYSEHHLFQSVKNGVKSTGAMTVLMYKIIKRLITGEVSVKELSGPVGIVYAVSDSAKAGVIYVIYLGALLSLNLAVMNMLPFPALDGGRLLFLLIRKITGRRVTDEMEGKVHFIGMMLLFALMIYVTWNDVLKFIIPNFS